MDISTLKFSPIKFDHSSLKKYEELFLICFPGVKKFNFRYLYWLYVENPEGLAIGYDVYDGDFLAAHYVCIPTLISINGVVERSLLSLNTATHPRYQGMGLFTKLASMTYDTGLDLGFFSVYGIANANSTHGFIRKLGFQLVGQLDAKIGLGGLNINFDSNKNDYFHRAWNSKSLSWRCANPVNPVYSSKISNGTCFRANILNGMASVVADLPIENPILTHHHNAFYSLHLFIGLIPEKISNLNFYFEMPQKLRPSPLNLIYLPLVKSNRTLDRDNVLINFLDFDAF